jgi:hypothetical protein
MTEASLYDHADLYDLVAADVAPAGQAAFYLRQAQACGGPVLELACGTGRLTLPMLEKATDYDPASQVSRTTWYFSARDQRDSLAVPLVPSQHLPAGVAAADQCRRLAARAAVRRFFRRSLRWPLAASSASAAGPCDVSLADSTGLADGNSSALPSLIYRGRIASARARSLLTEDQKCAAARGGAPCSHESRTPRGGLPESLPCSVCWRSADAFPSPTTTTMVTSYGGRCYHYYD